MKTNKKIYNLLIHYIIYALITYFLSSMIVDYLFNNEFNLLSNIFLQILNTILPLVIILITSKERKIDDEYEKLFHIKDYFKKNLTLKTSLLGIGLAICLFISINYIYIAIDHLIIYKNNSPIEKIELLNANIYNLILLTLSFSIIRAVFEEIIFRGMYNETLKSFNKKIQYILPMIVFALLHNNIKTAISAAIISLILTKLIRKSGTLKLCILIHATYNFMSIINLNYYNLPYSTQHLINTELKKDALIGNSLTAIGIALIAIVGFIIIFKELFKIKTKENFDVKKLNKINIKHLIILLILVIGITILRILR